MHFKKALLFLFSYMIFSPAIAAENIGQAVPWGLNLREPYSTFMEDSIVFHDGLMWLISIISLFVLLLFAIIVFRYNAKSNPEPSRTTHNTFLEVAWTAVPVLILVLMAIPSFKLLYQGDVVPESDVTIKAIGHQWYWSYEYPDHGNFTYDATMMTDEDFNDEDYNYAGKDRPFTRLLTTDTRVVVPVGKVIRVQVTSTDVIHAWAVPSLGVKKDSVPGRLNETWFKADREGIFYGQCSELCGQMHGFMPIEVHAVSEEKFLKWIEETKLKPDVYEYANSNEDKQIQLAREITK